MIRRLFALVILLAVAAVGLYYWKATTGRGPGLPHLPNMPHQVSELKGDLRDAGLTTAVRSAFALNRDTSRLELKVATESGVVTLSGTVPDAAARAAAERVASAVPEVKSVSNQLTLGASDADTNRSLIESIDDEKLELQVKAALSLNRDTRDLNLHVKTFRSTVNLTGDVATPAQKAAVLAVVQDTPGVSKVTDGVTVAGHDAPSTPPAP